MASTSVKVAVRVRPMAAKELLANSSECVEMIPGTQQIVVGGGPSGTSVGSDTVYQFTQKSFTFDYLFDENTSQEVLYNLSVAPLVERFLEGFNATILAYGQTGSGKTYSMGIGLDGINPSADVQYKGIVPRSISVIFDRLEQQKLENPEFQSVVNVSFMELYNEELIDLLNPRPRTASAQYNGPTIREDGSGKIVWQNLSEEVVTSTAELMSVLQKGTLCRTTGSTDMNASSSRSHAIFTVTLKQTRYVESETGKDKSSLVSKFHFVDLAGSERLKRTNAEGDRKKEGISINQGLLALGNVISALGDESRKAGHVPYRDSKLTRMLQDSLGGNSQTLMLACISPSDLNYGETVNTLHYANRARNIKNRVAINQDWGGSGGGETMREIKSLRATISQLRTEIAMIRANGVPSTEGVPVTGAPQAYHQRRERDQLAEIETLKSQLQTQSFQMDKYHFSVLRLMKKVQQLTDENALLAVQRDTAIVDKCHLLSEIAKNGTIANISEVLAGGPKKKQRRSRENSVDMEMDPGSKRSRSPSLHETQFSDPTLEETRSMISKYVKTIAQLRVQLSQCEDKLAWQYEAMSKLGKKGSRPRAAWSDTNLTELGINAIPALASIETAKQKEEPNLKGQRKVLEAIRENIELRNGKNMFARIDFDLEDPTMHPEPVSKGGSWLKFQFTGEYEDTDAPEDEEMMEDQKDENDLFLLINSIQNDIERHQNLMDRNQKREAEYEKMSKAYEQKLKVLQNQMSQFQRERDQALQKIATGSKQQRADAAIKYDEAKRKLDMEISDTRRKMGENSRMQTFNKARSDKLTSELQATINALKGEKNRMVQELRTQTQKHRDENTNNMREISKLKRREKNATDTVRRLERSNQLQRLMLKKRNDEMIRSQNKLKQIMRSLKRAATPNKITKSQYSSGFSSPIPGSRHGRRNGASMNEILASVNSPVRVSVSQSLTDTKAEDVDIQAQFKKQMVDKELVCTITCRKAQRDLEKLQACRKRLIEEQKELIAERKRVVKANYQQTGVFDERSPQYMDERVRSIDVEVASIDNNISQLEDSLKTNSGMIDDDAISNFVDLSWDNALNILRSLDRIELEATLSYFLEDVVTLRSQEEELQQELEDKENAIEALQSKLLDAQESVFKAINEAKQSIGKKEVMKETEVQTALSSQVIVDDITSEEEELPKYDPKSKKEKENMDVVPVGAMSIRDIEQFVRPRTTRSQSARSQSADGNTVSVSPAPEDLRGRPLQSRNSLESRHRSSSPLKEKPPVFLAPLKKKEELGSPQSSLTSLALEEEVPKPKKKYDLLTMGSDVFKRLANAHTQASQAKVINRTSFDKDSLMQEPLPSLDSKRKSLSELEQNWNMDLTQ